jgi:hypothetical protein
MIKLELTLDEVNYILQQVGKAPFAECAPLINKIHMQASPQVPAVPPQDMAGDSEAVIVEDAK